MRHPTSRHLFLAGFAGSGKTTVGVELARLLDRPFVDLDHQIEKSAGMTVSRIFSDVGERTFRTYETNVLCRLCRMLKQPSVVALGGGTLKAKYNREVIKRYGTSIYLRCSQPELLRRLASARNRPLLQTGTTSKKGRASVIRQLLAARRPAYEQCDYTISVTQATPFQAARRIRDAVE